MQGLGGFPDGDIGIDIEDIDAVNAQGSNSGTLEGLRISKIHEWGSAVGCLVQVGDILEKVSGYDVKGLSANFVQHLIKGPSGLEKALRSLVL
jgi:hypothetical protein